jgi:hypothetical protein
VAGVLVALLATLLPVLVHHELVLGNVVYYALDHAQLQYPRFAILCDALQQHGVLPYWQHLLYGGAPFHANPEIPTLYPPAVALAAFLPPARTMNVFIVLHMAAGALGMFLLVQHLWRVRLGRPGSLVAAGLSSVAFLLNFYTRLEHIHLVEYGAAHMLLPWILLATERVLLGARPGLAAAGLALLGGLFVHTGGLYVILFGGLFCAAWVVRFGLLGGAQPRRRALVWIGAAVVAAVLLALAKLLPYFAWLPVTNRAEPVPMEIACGRSLGGREFSFATLWEEIALRTGLGAGVALFALGALWLRREPLVRFLALTALLVAFFAAGPAYPWLYRLGAPFTLVRTGPERLWTIANLVWPIVAGLGVGAVLDALLRRLAHAGARTALEATAAVALPLALLPALLQDRESWRGILGLVEPVERSIARYQRWVEATDKAGDEWRVWWIGNQHTANDGDLTPIGDKNEQFFTTHVGAETLAGLLGYLWPVTLERHLYLGQDGVLDELGRTRRAGMLSARWLVSSRGPYNPADDLRQLDPRGVEGRSLVENPWARPRVITPRRVVAVFGDADMTLTYRLLDDISTPVDVSFLSFSAGDEPDAAECELFELVLLVDDTAPPAALPSDTPVVRTAAVPAPEVWRAIGAALGDEGELAPAGALVREGPNGTRVDLVPDERERFVVLSETWSTDPGWRVEVDGREVALRRADGIVTAVVVPAGARTLSARYAPPSIARGYLCGALGLLATLAIAGLGLWTRRRAP